MRNRYDLRCKDFLILLGLMLIAGCANRTVRPAQEQPTGARENLSMLTMPVPTQPTALNITYQPDDEHFPNPERGFYTQTNIGPGQIDLNEVQAAYRQKVSMWRYYFRLDDYKTQDLPDSYIEQMQRDFAVFRQGGVKAIIRFTYNFCWLCEDASKERILRHVEQLTPVLQANTDVIAYLEAGFIGNWGEWHHSTNHLTHDDDWNLTEQQYQQVSPWQEQKEIVQALLKAVPGRFVVLRYSRDKRAMFGPDPITPAESFNSSDKSRVGHMNDYFAGDETNGMTYMPSQVAWEKGWLSRETLYTPMGGETAGTAGVHNDCPAVLKELETLHFDHLNIGFDMKIIGKWIKQGCLPEIQKRLGYRLRLVDASADTQVQVKGDFALKINFVNEGLGKVYNPRPVVIVLRSQETGQEWSLPIQDADPRFWSPGSQQQIVYNGSLPEAIPPGKYHLFLFLPDPAPALYRRPEYAIRFANQDVWETLTGYNDLQIFINVVEP